MRGGIAGATAGITVDQPGDDAVGDQRVAAQTGITRQRAVRLRTNPSRKAKRAKRIGVQIALHRVVVDGAARVVGRQHSPVGVVYVGVRDVPFAVVVGVVARGAEPVAHGGHLAGPQPAHARIVGHLAEAIGLGDAVQIRVVPGENRWATGRAGQRAGVVPGKADAVLVEPLAAVQSPVPPGEHLG